MHIRDSATGETLRSESFTPLSKTPLRQIRGHHPPPRTRRRHRNRNPPRRGNRQTQARRTLPHRPRTASNHRHFRRQRHHHLPHHPHPPLLLPSIPPSLYPAITGYRLNPATQSLEEISTPARLAALSKAFPDIPPTFSIHTCETAVLTRLAAAFPEEFPDLTASSRGHAKIIADTFATGDPTAISTAIRTLPPSGLPTATALFLSLKSENPDYLRQTLAIAENVPAPLLNRDLPLPENYRNEQDWIGYESPDFSEIFTRRQTETTDLLSELELPPEPTEEDIQAFITHLLSPETQSRIARETLALSAINAARSLSETEATSSLQLAALAQRLGSPQAEILRTQATALTTLGELEPAHRAWISLITEQPEATHLPSDYSEAAHSAFENSDPDQAAEILRTGLFRFPDDVALAIRAGWIALLTDQPEQAADYLTRATRIGLPADEVENTTALLAIAHTQLGDPDTARAFLKQLTAINEKWADPKVLKKLPWPESFKTSLQQLTRE